jgi:hypothetical protein
MALRQLAYIELLTSAKFKKHCNNMARNPRDLTGSKAYL